MAVREPSIKRDAQMRNPLGTPRPGTATRVQRSLALGNLRTERMQLGTGTTRATFTMRDLEIYPSRLSSEESRKLAPKYTLSRDERNRYVLDYNAEKGWAYSDAEVMDMARDYVYGNERTRRIIYDRLEDANFHSDLARIQQLADDPEAIQAIERRTRNRRR